MKIRPGLPLPASEPQFSDRTSDARLVRECLNGSEAAWAALVEKYKRLIYAIPYKYNAGAEDAADIFQAVCLELFSELPKLRKTDSLRSWLITVTTHKCIHWKRKQLPIGGGVDSNNIEELAGAVPHPQILEEAAREQMLRDAMARLSPRCREIIRMLFYEQPPVPYEEVAHRLGLATGSIGFIRGRCLKRLERTLEEMGF